FLEEFNTLAHKLKGQIAHSGKITAGVGPASHEFAVDGIAAEAEHHGFGSLQRLHGEDHKLLRHDDVGIGREEFARCSFHVFPVCRPEETDRQIAAFDPTQLAQSYAQ